MRSDITLFTDIMKGNLNMLCTFVKGEVTRDGDGYLVVTMNRHWRQSRNVEFFED